jgi:hypothetical protein
MTSVVNAVKMTFQLDLVHGESTEKPKPIRNYIMDFKDATLGLDERLVLGIFYYFNHSADPETPVNPDVRFQIHAATLTKLMNRMNFFNL